MVYGWVNRFPLYAEYTKLDEYRRLHPEFIPSESFLRLSSAGHTTSYGDAIWISLIQYVGDNIASKSFESYTPTLLDRIYALHPYFMKPYEFSMLMLPTIFPNETGTGVEIKKEKTKMVLAKLESKLPEICDTKKIELIDATSTISLLWEDPNLKNPCLSGEIPYYMAFHYYNDLGMNQEAKRYYKIASANTDTPISTRYLISLMDGKSGNYLTAAFSLLSLAIEGEDNERKNCIEKSSAALLIVAKSMNMGKVGSGITDLIRIEKEVFDLPREKEKDTITLQCGDYLSRGLKQTFLAYIDERAKLMLSET
jgi:hypothetical protein